MIFLFILAFSSNIHILSPSPYHISPPHYFHLASTQQQLSGSGCGNMRRNIVHLHALAVVAWGHHFRYRPCEDRQCRAMKPHLQGLCQHDAIDPIMSDTVFVFYTTCSLPPPPSLSLSLALSLSLSFSRSLSISLSLIYFSLSSPLLSLSLSLSPSL